MELNIEFNEPIIADEGLTSFGPVTWCCPGLFIVAVDIFLNSRHKINVGYWQ